MPQASRLQGGERYRRMGHSTRGSPATPRHPAPISFFTDPTLVSKRVGCVVLRPTLDLTAACLK